jgi:hypothetical protein
MGLPVAVIVIPALVAYLRPDRRGRDRDRRGYQVTAGDRAGRRGGILN